MDVDRGMSSAAAYVYAKLPSYDANTVEIAATISGSMR
jgi:hypothetical protein